MPAPRYLSFGVSLEHPICGLVDAYFRVGKKFNRITNQQNQVPILRRFTYLPHPSGELQLTMVTLGRAARDNGDECIVGDTWSKAAVVEVPDHEGP